jgi:hypothetical protein
MSSSPQSPRMLMYIICTARVRVQYKWEEGGGGAFVYIKKFVHTVTFAKHE